MNNPIDLEGTLPDILRQIGSVADQSAMKVYAVGGYIRDLLIGKMADHRDIDLTVVGDALVLAEKVKQELGARTLVTYERFGTIMLKAGDYKLEFVTARKEQYQPGSRKPIVRKAGPEADLSRRDFTINALAVGLNREVWGKLYDPFGGLENLHNRLIRTPVDPQTTFEDDPLRILRAVRFAAVLGFSIEQRTRKAIKKMVDRLEIISKERIADELLKTIGASKPSRGLVLMDRLGVLPFVLPELSDMKGVEQRKDFHHKDVFHHTLMVLDNVAEASDKMPLRLAALFHDLGKPSTKQFDDRLGWTFHRHDEAGAKLIGATAHRLRLSKGIKNYIQKMIRLHLRPIFLASEEIRDSAIRRLIVQAGDDLEDLFLLCRADISSGNINRVRGQLQNLELLKERVAQVRKKDRLHRFQSPVKGDKIMEVCEIPPGPMVGKLKKEIEEAVLDGRIPNDYQAALSYLYEIRDRYMDEA